MIYIYIHYDIYIWYTISHIWIYIYIFIYGLWSSIPNWKSENYGYIRFCKPRFSSLDDHPPKYEKNHPTLDTKCTYGGFFEMGKPKWSSDHPNWSFSMGRLAPFQDKHIYFNTLDYLKQKPATQVTSGDMHIFHHISWGFKHPVDGDPSFDIDRSLQFPTSIFSVIFVLQSKSSGAIYLVSLLGVLYGEHGINRQVNETCRIWDNLDIFSGSLKWIYQMYPQVKPPLIKDGMEYDG